MATSSTDAVDAVLEKLLSVRGERPGKQVALEDNEIRMLCIRAREVFMAQPILLELEAPIKICGDLCGNQPVCWVHRQFFTKSFLGDDAAVLARSSVEEPAWPRRRAGVAFDGVEDDAMVQHERAVKF